MRRWADGRSFRTKHRCSHLGNTAQLIKGRRSKEHIARLRPVSRGRRCVRGERERGEGREGEGRGGREQ